MTDAFFKQLERIHREDDRAARATMRKAFQQKGFEDPGIYPYVFPYLGATRSKEDEDAYLMVAALFAMHPSVPTAGVSLGKAMRRVAGARESESIEGRFVALLRARFEDLPYHLRNAVSLIRATDDSVQLNYEALLKHLRHWSNPSGWVQLEWARDFWEYEKHTTDATA
ncbi:MAG: type I-E CRISPR-associated protein Cse2/CasB [Deltaproteobacteria bacterium CG2_30_63_29]|nr:MAG: type I-E CRISPR-associated protein Cse2/CasB [Deltaproteobacteria bacterium CG2_30_63_29]